MFKRKKNENIIYFKDYINCFDKNIEKLSIIKCSHLYIRDKIDEMTNNNVTLFEKKIINDLNNIADELDYLENKCDVSLKNIIDFNRTNCEHDWRIEFNEDHCNYVEYFCKKCDINRNNIIHLKNKNIIENNIKSNDITDNKYNNVNNIKSDSIIDNNNNI